MAALLPHVATALAISDADGTDNKNIIQGAVISIFDDNDEAVILYDDENGSNGSTTKQTDVTGRVTVYLTAGEYTERTNNMNPRPIVVGGKSVTSYETTADIQSLRPVKVGQRVENKERANAQYELMPAAYTPDAGDIVVANGLALRLIDEGVFNLAWLGLGTADDGAVINSALSRIMGRECILPAGSYDFATTVSINTTGLGDASTVRISGDGFDKTIINNKTGGPAIFLTSGTGAEFGYGFYLDNLTIDNLNSTAGTIGLRIEGNRLSKLFNVHIKNQASHGIYGLSTLGDFTDNAQINIDSCQIESNGGYGVYFASSSGGIQYATNIRNSRIGLNALGAIRLESAINFTIGDSTAVYYNGGTGIDVVSPEIRGAIGVIDGVEFDTNEGVQCRIDDFNTVIIRRPYLIANAGADTAYTKGIVIGDNTSGVFIEKAYPRYATSLTGLTTIEVEAGANDVVIRDTSYQGFSVLNGQQYNLLEPSVVVDDVLNRISQSNGTFTAQIKNLAGDTVSPTTVDGFYTVNGKSVTVSFRNLTDIDLTGFSGLDILKIDVPFTAIAGDGSGFVGQSIVTGLVGETQVAPTIVNGSGSILLYSMASGSLITADKLTSGSSDILFLTLTYMR